MEIDKNEKSVLKLFLEPDFPLLVAFRDKAPGTFTHCKNVSNLVESIALELELDVDKMLVAAMYHDVGKMNFPDCFSENQGTDVNMHSKLEPMISYHMITRHVGDSVLTMMKHDIPICILNMIAQHHGNTVVQAFYNKALDTNKKTIEDNFRYKCDTPKTTESAVLMICDCVEATARSKFNEGILKNSTDKENVVQKTIQRLVEDNQLDDMKVGQIKVITRTLVKEMSNIYHKREKYEKSEV